MFKLSDLKAAHNTKVERVKVLASKLETTGKLSDEERGEFTKLQSEISDIKGSIASLEYAQGLAIEQATSIESPQGPAIHVKKEPEDYPGAKVARFGMAIAAGKGDLNLAQKFAANEIGDKEVAMAVSTAEDSGGALVPETLSNDFIELLRPKTVVRALGAQQLPLVNGNLTMPRHTGGATSGYKGENESRNSEGQKTDEVKLSAKTQMTIVPVSNELIGYAGYNVERVFLNDMLQATATRQDKAFLRDDGTNNTPKGMRPTALSAGRVVPFTGDMSDTSNIAYIIDKYLDSLILTLENSDSAMISCGWALSPRSAMFLFGLRNGNGTKLYPEMEQGRLKGYPLRKTTNIPNNLVEGAMTDLSEIYFADFNDVLIGETNSMTIDFSREATYKDANGNLVSAYSNNQSVLRVVTGNDIGFRHEEGLVVGTNIKF
ncbi:phage major capsid protein [Pseudoalteromonas sp. S16_S37]|uniref:phage major capsid protein n=1 Tax=Pseudoalteromonas sp. S16_S37 TaxID=2720228 RepID=UPI001680ACEC|nr:phage major capsid protein [Pseudoalteromonas sp. S16_S37]MBD1583493.1 phage major capsid protein [Pseudoalteromonas sp. S16_S37]